VGTAEAGVGVRQEDLGLNIGEFDLRTLQGFDWEMQRLKGDLRIRLDQLAQTDKDIKDVTDHIAREDRKLQTPDATEDDLADVRNRKKALEDSLKNLQHQREAHLAYIREFSTELRGQVNRI
jgi:septal ring factor EnvC (AmiA/AmiB activator)